jgi:hypothetical protein
LTFSEKRDIIIKLSDERTSSGVRKAPQLGKKKSHPEAVQEEGKGGIPVQPVGRL